MSSYHALQWLDSAAVRMLDQRLLPLEVKYLETRDYRENARWIRDMIIRGAPAIGAAAGYGLALAAFNEPHANLDELRGVLEEAARLTKAARPTAVNLFWAVDRVLEVIRRPYDSVQALQAAVLAEAHEINEENLRSNIAIGQNAQAVVPPGAVFVHHCNTGPLATVEHGTALGVILTAHARGNNVFVYVDETRPRLQGARLTSWELKEAGVPHAIIADGASGYVMKYRHVDLCVVGCDRIAANGDTANKIGTYNLALVARAHGVPFYVVGPTSTVDLSIPTGDSIHIEERSADEVTHIGSEQVAPDGVDVFNPAFDVTPAEYITGIITEAGIAYPPFSESLPAMVEKARAMHRQAR